MPRAVSSALLALALLLFGCNVPAPPVPGPTPPPTVTDASPAPVMTPETATPMPDAVDAERPPSPTSVPPIPAPETATPTVTATPTPRPSTPPRASAHTPATGPSGESQSGRTAGQGREPATTAVTPTVASDPTTSPVSPAAPPSTTSAAGPGSGVRRPVDEGGSGFVVSEPVEDPDPRGQATVTPLEPDTDEVLYTWDDGGDTRRVWLRSDLVVQPTNENTPRDAVVRGGDGESIVKSQPRHNEANSEPVFRTESGQLATLPGGVILVLDRSWDQVRVDRFFTGRGIARSRVEDLTFASNAFLVETEPGLPSLELANALAGLDGVIISSPNWRSELVLN